MPESSMSQVSLTDKNIWESRARVLLIYVTHKAALRFSSSTRIVDESIS